MADRTDYYVHYSVNLKEFQAGPYPDEAIADEHRRDIAGYEGISNCYVSHRAG